MPTLTFVEDDGTEVIAQARLGESVMRAARAAGVSGIVGECGGCMNCLTCHCYVPPDLAASIPPPSDGEAAMLDGVALAREGSRLSCQIVVTEQLDGAHFALPPWQG